MKSITEILLKETEELKKLWANDPKLKIKDKPMSQKVKKARSFNVKF